MEIISIALMGVIGAAGAFLGLFSLTNLNQNPLDVTRSGQPNPKGAPRKVKQA